MSDQRRQRRGRPKGSGINDWERLFAIAALMSKDPKLKVTTAIRKLGFQDPSVIRRLRDKFKVNKAVLLSDKPIGRQVARQPEMQSAEERRPTESHASRHTVTDFLARGSRPFSMSGGLQATMMRCLLDHPTSGARVQTSSTDQFCSRDRTALISA